MRNEPPIAECAFGWGQTFRLYQQYIDVNGTHYALSDLTHLRPVYQHILGISSVRLELRFGKKRVILRGIAALEDAQKAIDYLTSQYLGFDRLSGLDGHTGWSRVRETGDESRVGAGEGPGGEGALVAARHPESQLVLWEHTPITDQDLRLQERAQAPTDKVETPTRQRFLKEQREHRQRRLKVERSLREHGFDVEKLAQRLKEETLPEVVVPMRLQVDERAHYCTDATLCGEPIGGVLRYTYPAKDHGTLILTNKRLVYIGRKSQIVLDYARLLHVSRLRGAIAFQAEHWYRREIFEVPRSLECTMHLECILERFQQEQRLQAFTNSFLDDDEQAEEAAVSLHIDTMPLSLHHWDRAEVIDS